MGNDVCPDCGIGKVSQQGWGPYGPRYRCDHDECSWVFDKHL